MDGMAQTPITMASVRQGDSLKPPRIMVYGTAGVGKTSLAAAAPNPIFIQTEDGLGDDETPTFGLLKTFDQVLEAIGALYNEEHDRQTVVVDSLDWLEPLIYAQTCRDNEWASIETPGYGKGYAAALDHWRLFLSGMNELRNDRGMTIILLAHCEIKRFDSPENEPYDRYQPKLRPAYSALVQEHVDATFFANFRVTTEKSEVGFNKKVVRGTGGRDRVLYTVERPAYLAKHRRGMTFPDYIPLDWSAVEAGIPYYSRNPNA